MIVTFCGHSSVPESQAVETWLLNVIETLIKKGATQFYLGGYGEFDSLAHQAVQALQKVYPHVESIYIMAYVDRPPCNVAAYDDTIYPPIEVGPLKFAISRRNRWMIDRADIVVAFIQHENYGGASQMWKRAKGQGKLIVRYSCSVS